MGVPIITIVPLAASYKAPSSRHLFHSSSRHHEITLTPHGVSVIEQSSSTVVNPREVLGSHCIKLQSPRGSNPRREFIKINFFYCILTNLRVNASKGREENLMLSDMCLCPHFSKQTSDVKCLIPLPLL